MLSFLNYLEHDHMRHCVPSHVSSGLATLPVDYVYKDGKPTTERTTKTLPTGERLNGAQSYNRIVTYFTTTDISVDEIFKKGMKQKDVFYQEVNFMTQVTTELPEKFQNRIHAEFHFRNGVVYIS
jgi:hypothetical protein